MGSSFRQLGLRAPGSPLRDWQTHHRATFLEGQGSRGTCLPPVCPVHNSQAKQPALHPQGHSFP